MAAESLAIQITNGGSRSIVQLAGELELASAAACREALDGILHGGRTDILIDLRGLTFLDSMGLSTLVHAHLVGAERGRRVSFVPGRHSVQRVFEITEMDARVESADAVERLLLNAAGHVPPELPHVSGLTA